MRQIETHRVGGVLNDGLAIRVLDDPGAGGASARYEISHKFDPHGAGYVMGWPIKFQIGPAATIEDINGISIEALLAIVADRLEGFEAGPFACRENGEALENVKLALDRLRARAEDRSARGVMNTLAK